MRSAKKPTNTSVVYRCPKNCRKMLDKSFGDEVMGETPETSVFTGDSEGNRAKLPKKRGSVMAPPSPKPKPYPKSGSAGFGAGFTRCLTAWPSHLDSKASALGCSRR